MKRDDEAIEKTDVEQDAETAAASEHIEEEVKNIDFVVKLSETHHFEGKDYKEVDLSGVRKLTTKDAEMLDKTMQLIKHTPGTNKFYDSIYMKHMAVRATGKPIEFFNTMSMKNFELIKSRLLIYFLFE